MIRSCTIFILLAFMVYGISFSQTYTVSGYVTDLETGETLIGAAVIIKGTSRGVVTDGNGFFRLTGISSGEVTLVFSHIGYESHEAMVEIAGRSVLMEEIQLIPAAIELRDVTITAVRQDIIGDREIETSQKRLTAQTILNIPSARGDIFRAIKFLPGIDATEPFSPLYTARGSDPSGNLVLLDGVAIYNPYHYEQSGGLFNIQSVKNVDVMVGGFGAEFGGRNASILYITTKDGNFRELRGEVEPTTTHTRLFLEFPVGERGSMMVAGRYFYDLPGYFIFGSRSYFYDANISYTNRLNERNRLTIKLFDSFDDMKFRPDRMFTYIDNTFNVDFYGDTHMQLRNSWTNRAATAYLKTIVTPNIFLHTQIYGSFHSANNYSSFDMTIQPDESDALVGLYYNTRFTSKINDLNARSVLNIKPDSINTIKLGIEFNSYHFNNGAVINHIDKGQSIRNPNLLAAFLEDKLKIRRFILRPGIRLSGYSLYNDWQVEPRLNIMINLPYNWKLKAAWGIYYQDIISMNTQEYEINQFLDYHYPLKDVGPSKSIHYITGFEKFLPHNVNLSVEVYYIDMPVTYTFDLNQSELEAHAFSDKLKQGAGRSYGVEMMLKADFSKVSGWASYSLGRSTRSYPHIMNGKSFLFDFDRTHNIKTMMSYRIAPRLTYNFSLVALSGLPKTVETAMQNYYFYNPVNGSYAFYPFGVAETKNNARLPWIIDVDMGIMKRIRKGFGAELREFLNTDESYLTVSIGNILFLRRNVYWYFPYGGEKYIPIGLNFLPSISAGYVIKF
jgi:hypothetical protein